MILRINFEMFRTTFQERVTEIRTYNLLKQYLKESIIRRAQCKDLLQYFLFKICIF